MQCNCFNFVHYLVGLTGSKVIILFAFSGHFTSYTRYLVQQITQQLDRTVSYSPIIVKQSFLQLW